jgi:hypothetical protein
LRAGMHGGLARHCTQRVAIRQLLLRPVLGHITSLLTSLLPLCPPPHYFLTSACSLLCQVKALWHAA